MPRIRMGFEDYPRKTDGKLVERLVDELKASRESGQPFIYEESFTTGKVRVLVIWDDWKDLPLEERTNIILSAVEKADGKDYRAKVALASGLTVPEGVAAGMLPYQIIPAHRKADKVTLEQCREAMLAEGASKLFGPNALQLRFPTEDAAEACRTRLVKRLPNSDEIWIVTREITAQDFGQVSESVALGPG
jgi:hypothetical protein